MDSAAVPAAPLHDRPAEAPWREARTARLPGTVPVDPGDWLRVDEAFAAQMAERERLLAERPDDVLALAPGAEDVARDLLDTVLAALAARADYRVEAARAVRPDGIAVALDRDRPLATLGRLAQEDFCLLDRPAGGAEHVLVGAVLCFPAGWTLREKLGRPLAAVHGPVAVYDADIARRVQRLCDGVRPGWPILRANAHLHADPTLFAPLREGMAKPPRGGAYLRVERQVLLRLPRTGAVVFSIHTSVTPVARLPERDRAALGCA